MDKPTSIARQTLLRRLTTRLNLRYPSLVALMAALTVLDFVIPDPIPLLDEVGLLVLTLLLASWKTRRPGGGGTGVVLMLAATLAAPAMARAQLAPEKTLDRYTIADLRLSPDGARLAFAVTEPVKGTTRNTDIWVLDVAAGTARRFTASPKSDTSPRWSPDGRTLAFLSEREEGGAQIYLMPAGAGEPVRLTRGKQSIRSFEWSPDGAHLACLARVPKTDERERREKDKADERVADDGAEWVQAWIVDAASGAMRQLTTGRFTAAALQWHPAGDRLLVVGTDQPESDRFVDRLYSVAVDDGARRVVAEPKGPIGSMTVAPDGRLVAYTGARGDGPSPHDLYVVPVGGGPPRNLTAASLDRPVMSHAWRADGTLVASVADGFSSRIVAIGQDGRVAPVPTPIPPSAFAIAPSGALMAFVGQRATELPEVWLSRAPGQADKVTSFHASWTGTALRQPRVFRYRSSDGVEIEAALLTPEPRTDGLRPPLVVLIHGGPTGRWSDSFDAWGQMLVSRGFAVLSPNIRGSTGYGWPFIEANRADWGGGDFKDVMAGVDAVIEQGLADRDHVGIGGWSYGGYMSAWAITQTPRFTASVVGAGLSDLASEFGTEDGSAYDEWFFGTPYEHLQEFTDSSPITFISKARTPTLILHGEDDATDPIGQGQQLYRGLKRYGAPVEFVVYPREGHGIREEQHQVDLLRRMLGWFERYVAMPAR